MVLLLLVVSWVLLRFQKKGLGVLGLNQPARRLREFEFGFLVAGLAAALQQVGFGLAMGIPWQLNPGMTAGAIWESLRWNTNSVLVEELLFRGYLLYQACRLLGPRQAVWLAAAAFGIYHWFSYGAIGNPAAMAYVFILTASFGGMCALAFTKTDSMVAPIGLHLGWNLIMYGVFSAGPLGPGLLIPSNGEARLKPPGVTGFLFGFVLPVAFTALVALYLHRYHKTPAPKASDVAEQEGAG